MMPLLVPLRQNFLVSIVALAVAETPNNSVKVAQHEPTAHSSLVAQGFLEAASFWKVFTLTWLMQFHW